MLAVGPPMSLTLPRNQGRAVSLSSSCSTLASLLDWMVFPWWWVMAQKAHPPKQPRWVVIELLICS